MYKYYYGFDFDRNIYMNILSLKKKYGRCVCDITFKLHTYLVEKWYSHISLDLGYVWAQEDTG